jgi:DUF4097 and DUF4098 domain-containing protein YvlB
MLQVKEGGITMLRSKVPVITLLILCTTAAFSFEKVKDLRLSTEGIHTLKIDSGSGFLKVTGNESLRAIEVKAEIDVKGKSDKDADEYIRKNVVLTLERKGDKAVLVSKFKNKLFFGSRAINLTVNVPKNIHLDVDEGSGKMSIQDITGDIYVNDGSGEIKIENIQGNIKIDDGSGSVSVNDVEGDVSIDDGSGTIDVSGVSGTVVVDDGSGSINIEGVGGDVHIKDDGSGSLSIRDVKGKVIK